MIFYIIQSITCIKLCIIFSNKILFCLPNCNSGRTKLGRSELGSAHLIHNIKPEGILDELNLDDQN